MSRSRPLSFLAMLAVLLMPLGMIGAAPAAAMPHHSAAASADHCPEMQDEDKGEPQRGPSIDCAIACAALPSAGSAVAVQLPLSRPAEPELSEAGFDGVNPEAITPPPRFS